MFVKSLFFLLCLHCARSITNEDLYPSIGPDGQYQTLTKETDDSSSSEIQLKVPIVFYGEIYKSLFVNANGLISFLTEIPSFSNVKFPLSFPVIAPLYTDVDIRKSGDVYYRETVEQNLLKRAGLEIQPNFKNYADFKPTSLFIVTWDKVGYYDKGIRKVNTFQVVVASNGTESFAQFLFPENGIQWIQSSGKNPVYPDARAQSGFISETGEYYELEDSGTDQVSNLELLSNTELPGHWLFHIGSITSTELRNPDVIINTIKTEANSKTSSAPTCASHGRSECHTSAKCNDYKTTGFCCECNAGFFGDGKNCLKKNAAYRVSGKINGMVNNVRIKNFDMHAYVVTKTGRTFTALSRVPSGLGHDMLSLPVMGTALGWLFAVPRQGAKNGYEMTGGVLNRSVEVEFPLTGDHIAIRQYFMGLDAFGYLELRTDITGTTPAISEGTRIKIRDYDVQYNRVKSGLIKTHSRNAYRIKDSGLETPYTIDETISFEECAYRPKDKNLDSLRMRVGRNYVIYDVKEGIVRYATSNRIAMVNRANPCLNVQCGAASSCVADRDTYRCVCNPGFQMGYANNKSQGKCTDIDECTAGRDNCHINAECLNQRGSFTCRCKAGFTGDGLTCEKKKSCDDLTCAVDATCRLRDGGDPQCICNSGFNGDGYVCVKDVKIPKDCRRTKYCDTNARCVYVEETRIAVCQCNRGYTGDGSTCRRISTRSCSDMMCAGNAQCRMTAQNLPECSCNSGYIGDGFVCNLDQSQLDCRRTNYCDVNAKCVYDKEAQRAICQCNSGYTGNGSDCQPKPTRTCTDVTCDANAQCRLTANNIPECICNPGYVGDGFVCNIDRAQLDCRRTNYCDANAKCVYDKEAQRAICQCNSGYTGNGSDCQPKPTRTCSDMTCDANAQCRLTGNNISECICNPGYVGNGFACNKDTVENLCSKLGCDENAACVFDEVKQQPVCECKRGFYGDGTKCERRSCDQLNCDENAACHFTHDGQPECICNAGFSGNGYVCQKDQEHIDCRRINNCDKNADCQYNYEKNWAECRCRSGFIGDGLQCQATTRSCDELQCDANATCHFTADGLPQCICNTGFVGNGYICQKEEEKADCVQTDYCDVNADCLYNEMTKTNECRCKTGYTGDGVICLQEQNVCDDCDDNADCKANAEQTAYECVCKTGYTGDGKYCKKKELSCNVLNRCHAHATCEYDAELGSFKCRCNEGYQGDGYQCTAASKESCRAAGQCSPFAECQYQEFSLSYVCKCNEGYAGDGYMCQPLDECNSVDDCDLNAQCMFEDQSSRYVCLCNQGYIGDGKICKVDPNAGCDLLKDCHSDATCTYDSQNDIHVCRCNQGFIGDGLDCTPEIKSCNVIDNCDINANCVSSPQGYRCQCKLGYRGNGFTCIASRTCKEEPRLCHGNADCILREDINQYACHCKVGFTGDGSICRAVPSTESEFLLFNQGMSILKMPILSETPIKGEVVVMEQMQTAVGLDVDCYNGYVYWTDVAQPKIKRARYNGSEIEVVLDEGLQSPESIAVDWVSGNIYWTDSMLDTIEVMSIEGKYRRVLINEGLKNPRGIAVNPSREKLYWSDWHRDSPKIEYSNLDGTNRKLLVSVGLGLPNALAIDYIREELCWADAGEQKIECMGMRDGIRRTIASPIAYPFGLAVYQDVFYWTDWKEKFIHKLKRGETDEEKLPLPLGGNGKLYSIAVVPKQCPRGSNACAIQNGGCQFLCLPNGRASRSCVCPDEAKTSNSSEYAVCNEIN